MALAKHDVNFLAGELVEELIKALGFPREGPLKWLSKPLVWSPMVRFSELAVKFEELVFQQGFQKASAWFISNFVDSVTVMGAQAIPAAGPLIIASNHPGAYDSLVIAASLPRSDVKIISSPIPFLQKFSFAHEHLIFSDQEAHARMAVVRKSLRHLEDGGALLVFAGGTIDPDPASMPGTEKALARWSSSLGLFLHRVPRAKMTIAFVSGILDPRFIKHPLTILRRSRVDKQRISEFFQVIRQLLTPERLLVSPRISFADPLSLADLGGNQSLPALSREIICRATAQYHFHLNQLVSRQGTGA